jgi:hypothetical protein
LATSSHDSTLHNAPVTFPVFAMGCVPTTITVIYERFFSPLTLFLQASHFGTSSSNSASSQHSDFSATSAFDFNIGRLMSTIHPFKAWQELMQPRIDEAMARKQEIDPRFAQLVAHQRDTALSINL